jgi:hypothetical protein
MRERRCGGRTDKEKGREMVTGKGSGRERVEGGKGDA